MKIINISTFPPPIGGVSKFLERLVAYLTVGPYQSEFYDISGKYSNEKKEKGIKCLGITPTFLRVMSSPKSLVILHSTKLLAILGSWIIGKRHISVLMIHNERILDKSSNLSNRVAKFLLKKQKNIIAVTENMKERLINELKIKRECIYVFEPYLLKDLATIPIEEKSFDVLRKKVKILIYSYAYRWETYLGADLYGIDMVVETVSRLITEGFDVGAVIHVPNHVITPMYEKLKDKINRDQIQNKIIFLTKYYHDSTTFYTNSDIHIRATNTDGCATTIFECLMCGTPVIASDCVPRFEGTILFKNRDSESLYIATKQVIENIDLYKEKTKKMSIADYGDKLMQIFKTIEKNDHVKI
ncbi:MAG: glycosyltransferase [Clostridioides sp.]|nr:glycosyltransferase [Clostridioides sp.]